MPTIIKAYSPNFSPSTHKKIGVQIHKTLGLMPGTLEWLQNPESQASSHVLFARNGFIYELVDLKDRSWSAGVISNPSPRARNIMLKTMQGEWIKPGHYLVQCEFECLANQTFTKEQYESAVWYFNNKLGFKLESKYFLEHQDTADYKPDLDAERVEILKRLNMPEIVVPKPKDATLKKLLLQLKVVQLRLVVARLLLKLFKRK